MITFVPLTRDSLASWAATGVLPDAAGYAALPPFLDAFGLVDPVDEDTDLTLATIASVASWLSGGVRLVAVAEIGGTPTASEPEEFGAVSLGALPYAAVVSLFADDSDAAIRWSDARAKVTGGLGEAWGDPVVEGLVADTDLLWHGPEEWERLAR